MLAALMITAGLSQFLGGWLGDRFRRRFLVVIGLGGVSISTFTVGILDSYELLVAIFVVTGLFAGLYHPSSVVLLSDSVESNQRGRVMASHMIGGSLGYLVAPLLGGIIAGFLGWQAAFMFLCIPALIAAFCSLAYLPDSKSHTTAQQLEKATPEEKTPWYRVITVSSMSVLMEVASGAAVAFFALFLVDVQGLTPVLSTTGLGVLRCGSLAGSLLGGLLADRWGNNRAVLLSFIASGPILLLLSYLTAIPFFIALFSFGLFYTMREVTVQVYLLKITPMHLRSRLIGVYYGFGMEGSSLIQPVAGHAMDRFGITGVYIWLGVASTIISMAMPILFLIGMRKPGRN